VVIFLYLYNLWTVRDHLIWREAWPLLATGLVAVPVGVWLLSLLDAAILQGGLAAMILAGCAVTLWQPDRARIQRPAPWGFVAGGLGGLFGGALGTGGPPVVLYALLRGWKKGTSKCVFAIYFLVLAIWRFIMLNITGVGGWRTTRVGLILVLPALGGSFLGKLVFERMSNRTFRYAAMLLLVGLAIKLVIG
jgi:uncharacterized membrane protein YfcA